MTLYCRREENEFVDWCHWLSSCYPFVTYASLVGEGTFSRLRLLKEDWSTFKFIRSIDILNVSEINSWAIGNDRNVLTLTFPCEKPTKTWKTWIDDTETMNFASLDIIVTTVIQELLVSPRILGGFHLRSESVSNLARILSFIQVRFQLLSLKSNDKIAWIRSLWI